MNTVVVSGNLTTDIVTRDVGEHQVHSSTLAINQGEHTTFLPFEAWDMPHLERYLKKGSKVLIRGALKQNNWETDEGEKRSRLLATAYEVEFVDPPRRSATAADRQEGDSARSQRNGPRSGSGNSNRRPAKR